MSLDYKLDYKVGFSKKGEHKNLYSWCLREFDKDGKQIGRDQIPWRWGVNFSVVDLAYNLSFEREKHFALSKDKEPPQPQKQQAVRKENLFGRLIPEESGPSSFRTTRYSFFGTTRVISDFTIRIFEGEEEAFDVWGSPEYDYEIDFANDTQPDALQISVALKPDHFRHIAELVKSKSINESSLRLSGVDGFYSEWNPGISTNDVKVLPAGREDGKVDFLDEEEREIPRLGQVREYYLSFVCKGTTSRESAEQSNKRLEEPEVTNDQEPAQSKDDRIAIELVKQTERLEKINKVLIVVVAIVIFVAFKLIG